MIVKGDGKFKREIRNILIIQLGDIGDVVWATPTFRAVNEAFPRAYVSVMVREGFGSLLEADPNVHRIFEVAKKEGRCLAGLKNLLLFMRKVRKEHFDLIFDLRLDDRGAFMAFIAGAPVRVSAFHRSIFSRNLLFTHLVDPARSDEKIRGAAEQSLRIVREFGINTENTSPRLWINDSVMERVYGLLDRKGLSRNQKWVSLNPFSRWQYKEWAYEKWAKIIDQIWETYGLPTVIVGSSEETEKARSIKSESRGPVFDFTGKTTLSELTGLLSLSHLHMGVDSAAPHVAAAVDTPTITVYGPSDWRDWAPQGEIHGVITSECDCMPCHQKGCDDTGKSKCLEELTIDTVKEEIFKFLHEKDLIPV
jgi:lipopolysaccharide heptosyltransferase II